MDRAAGYAVRQARNPEAVMLANALDFAGKTVLVVGGSSGIGNGIAHAFKDCGATVYVAGTRPSAADYAGVEGSDLDGLTYFHWDVASDRAVAALIPPFRHLDVLVLAQGTVIYKRGEFQMEGFRKVIDVNLMSVMACALKFHDMLTASGGSIIIVGSGASFHAVKGNPAYSASKGGLRTLTMTLAEAWASDGIRVNGLAPGFVDTKITKVTRDNPKRYEGTLQAIPLGRWGTPEDMGGVALFLASPLSAYVTGQMVWADGGMGLS
jgi:3-oxoacyl-[acyl-carrier protein] reductase